ncbi:hypothetical protein A6A04_14270 [Paramagnetospirillum marisnigri]|uniref:Antitoxin n=1 Tax=Paramagnetospirillum marisnigri TaxID=1285242 RepID=A0A178MTG8_9PROT|nr:DUF433 domain-containing protein [Paramagnetospirillum marisnigri]OAN53124.1 hypothetical protein A6A04_14270 [Paramagnetospirillum marisnigri]
MPHRMKSEVIKDPNVMGGQPVLRGTRVPAHFVAWLVKRGVSEFDILDDYPSLTREDIRVAVAYAAVHPQPDEG